MPCEGNWLGDPKEGKKEKRFQLKVEPQKGAVFVNMFIGPATGAEWEAAHLYSARLAGAYGLTKTDSLTGHFHRNLDRPLSIIASEGHRRNEGVGRAVSRNRPWL